MTETGKNSTHKARKSATPEIPAHEIERRAYEKFAARGYAHGADFDDWREAETELASELAPKPKRAAKAAAKAAKTDAAEPAPKKRAAKAADAPAAKSPARRTRKQA